MLYVCACVFYLHVSAFPATLSPLQLVRARDCRDLILSLRLRPGLSYLSDSLSQSIKITLGDEDLKDDEGETLSEPEDHTSDITASNLIVTNRDAPRVCSRHPDTQIPLYAYMSDL